MCMWNVCMQVLWLQKYPEVWMALLYQDIPWYLGISQDIPDCTGSYQVHMVNGLNNIFSLVTSGYNVICLDNVCKHANTWRKYPEVLITLFEIERSMYWYVLGYPRIYQYVLVHTKQTTWMVWRFYSSLLTTGYNVLCLGDACMHIQT